MRTLLMTVAILGLTASLAQADKCCKAPKRKKSCCCYVVVPCQPATVAPAAPTKPAPYDDAATPPAPAAEKK
ncbi:MAG: hypothetical protein HZA46_25020 [Planctomycetales bacterium]|nr:hypothetical protein [Planctomycetales bacterium]